jgi:hypothetical protein
MDCQTSPVPTQHLRKVEISSPCHAWTVKRPLRPLSTSGTVIFFCVRARLLAWTANGPLTPTFPRKVRGERFHCGRARCRVGMRLAGTEGLGWLGLAVRNERGGGSLRLFLEKRGLKPRVPGMHGLPLRPSESPACGCPAQLAPCFRRPDGTKTDQKSLQSWHTDQAKAGCQATFTGILAANVRADGVAPLVGRFHGPNRTKTAPTSWRTANLGVSCPAEFR